MKYMLKLLLSSLLAIVIISGCSTNDDAENIFKYKDSYVGDNSAVGNILNQLQKGEHLTSFELQTKEEPYGIILNYDWPDTELNYQKTAIYNATFLLALVHNADWVSFHFGDRVAWITRTHLLDWYGEDFSRLQTEEELEALIQNYVNDEQKVNELFKGS